MFSYWCLIVTCILFPLVVHVDTNSSKPIFFVRGYSPRWQIFMGDYMKPPHVMSFCVEKIKVHNKKACFLQYKTP